MVRVIERAFDGLATLLAWLMVGLAVLATSVLVLRYGFGLSTTAVQDAVIYLNAGLVMLGLSVTLLANAHVRVDVLSDRWPTPLQALRDLLGVIFLVLPMLAVTAWHGWDYVARAWAMSEGSGDAGGLAGVYWFKSLILVGVAVLFMAALVFAYRAFQVWRGEAQALPAPSHLS